jgi:gamma-glutamyl-gamma-aminobutyrate hydrolase PuuD
MNHSDRALRAAPRGPSLESRRSTVDAGSRLARWMGVCGPLQVTGQHHQDIAVVGAGLRVVARAVDHLIEAVELHDEPVVGVQWHPEVL